MKIGAHVSIAGGYLTALAQAKVLGANAIQIFSSPPRSWDAPTDSSPEIKKFLIQAQKQKVADIFIHAKYLINLASDNQPVVEKSIASLIQDMKAAEALGAKGVIFHPHLGRNEKLRAAIETVLSQTPAKTQLILENSAQTDLGQLVAFFASLDHSRTRLCLDTAHLFESGMRIDRPSGIARLFASISPVGWNKVALIHANDSRTAFGSKHDVHENIGEGQLGKEAFIALANHPQTEKLPFILETPAGKDDPKDQKINIDRVRAFAGPRLKQPFFGQKTASVARQLLGKMVVVSQKNGLKLGLVTETEAYLGPQDKACHSAKGRTARTEPMYKSPGTSYIYQVYGKHFCLNLVTEKTGFPAAVLIRGLRPLFGLTGKADGPGKVCRELELTKEENCLDTTRDSRLYIKDVGLKPHRITASARIGVEYAQEWAEKKLRFVSDDFIFG